MKRILMASIASISAHNGVTRIELRDGSVYTTSGTDTPVYPAVEEVWMLEGNFEMQPSGVDPDANPLTAATQQQEDIADSYFDRPGTTAIVIEGNSDSFPFPSNHPDYIGDDDEPVEGDYFNGDPDPKQ